MDFSNLEDIKNHLGQLEKQLPSKEFVIEFEQFRIHCLDNYSPPYHDYNNLLYYKSVSIFIFEDLHDKEEAISPIIDLRFQNFTWAKYFNYTDSLAKIKPSYMGAQVPIPEVIQLTRDIYKVSRLKMFY